MSGNGSGAGSGAGKKSPGNFWHAIGRLGPGMTAEQQAATLRNFEARRLAALEQPGIVKGSTWNAIARGQFMRANRENEARRAAAAAAAAAAPPMTPEQLVASAGQGIGGLAAQLHASRSEPAAAAASAPAPGAERGARAGRRAVAAAAPAPAAAALGAYQMPAALSGLEMSKLGGLPWFGAPNGDGGGGGGAAAAAPAPFPIPKGGLPGLMNTNYGGGRRTKSKRHRKTSKKSSSKSRKHKRGGRSHRSRRR